MPLGMEDQRILSGQLRASSSYNYNHGPDRARLNIYAGHGRTGAWVARYRNTKQWLQIDLRQMSIIKGIATQGRREAHQWVRSYHLSYSRFGIRFRAYVAYGRVKVGLDFVLRTELFFFVYRISSNKCPPSNKHPPSNKRSPPSPSRSLFYCRDTRKTCFYCLFNDNSVCKLYNVTKVRLITNRRT